MTWIAGVYRISESVDQLQILGLTAVRQVSRKTGTVKACWKDVLEEQVNELIALHGQELLFSLVGIVNVAEGDGFIIHGYDAAVCNRGAI